MKAFLLAAVSLLCTGCPPGPGREEPPSLYISPPSALQQSSLVISLTAQGTRLSGCEFDTTSALVFSNSEGLSQITVHSLTVLDDTTLRSDVAVDPGAEIGFHSVVYECDANTTLHGVFEVRQRLDDPLLLLDPDTAPAGSTNLDVKISTEDTYFLEDLSHVVFGDGTGVAVKKEVIVSGSNEMTVTVDISPLAPVGEMEVAVVTGSVVARGSFDISERIYSTVQVIPDQVVRPAPGDVPVQATIQIAGEGTFFESAQTDAGPGEGSVVSFPGNPGITVTLVDVESPTNIVVNIMVDENALLGPWPLQVATGDDVVTTDFTVLPPEDEPVLVLSPARMQRGWEEHLVLATVYGAVLDGSSVADFSIPGCTMESHELLTDRSMALWVSVDDATLDESAVIEISTTDGSVTAMAVLVDQSEPFALRPEPVQVSQGYSGFVTLEVEGYSLSAAASASVVPGSGVKIVNQTPWVDGSAITVQLRVAPDAPVGPTPFHIVDGPLEMTAYLRVAASGAVPYLEISPSVIVPGGSAFVLDFDTTGINLVTGDTHVRSRDPEVIIQDVQVISPGSARVTVDAGSSTSDDVVTFYLSVGEERAAATCRSMEISRPVAMTSQGSLSRNELPDLAERVLIYADVTDMSLESVIAQIPDGIGVEVERVTAIDEVTLEIELEVQPNGGTSWPGGWFGIVLSSWDAQAVLPIHIEGADQSLTAPLNPLDFPPGTSGQMMSASVSPANVLHDAISRASSSQLDAWTWIYDVPSETQALIKLDLAHLLEVEEDGVPLCLTAKKGAAVGFVESEELFQEALSESTPWEDDLLADQVRLLVMDPGQVPAVVIVSEDRPGYADLEARLISGNGPRLQSTSPDGRIFALEGGVVAIEVTGDPGGDPSSVTVHSIGDVAQSLLEPDDQHADAHVVATDPCDTPFLGASSIGGAMDVDRIEVGSTTCRAVALVVARVLGDMPWATPDPILALVGDDDATLETSEGWPDGSMSDPRIYFDASVDARQVLVGAQLGTEGLYLVNVRRPVIVNEVCRETGSPYIELEFEPGQVMDGISVELVDADTGLVQAALALTGTAPADGLVVIGDILQTWVDIDDSTGVTVIGVDDPFVVRLMSGAVEIDAVQVGGLGSYGEGDPVTNDTAECFERFARVDTGDNLEDFIPSWVGTPGR